MKAQVDQEVANKRKAEAALLDADKKNSELKVEVTRLQQKLDSLKTELQAESEKVFILYEIVLHILNFILSLNNVIITS